MAPSDPKATAANATIALALALALVGCARAPGPGAGRLAVVDKYADQVELIDLASRRTVARFAVGRGPHEVVASRDGRRLYVSNYGNDVTETGTGISVIETATDRVRHVSVAPYVNPHGLDLADDDRRLWLTVQGPGPNAVLALDAATGTLQRAFETGQQYSHMVVVLPGRGLFAVTNIESGSLSLVEPESGRVRSLETGAGAADVAVSPDGRLLFVPNEDADTISVVGVEAAAVVETVAAGGRRPVRVELTPDGRELWVSYFAEARVAVFDARTRERLAVIPLPGAPAEGAIGLLISPDGRRAWVSHMEADRVFVLDVRARSVVDVLETGRGPDGMAYLP